jgi:uncharacterized protein YprB with RNaseH-like and TPR domain
MDDIQEQLALLRKRIARIDRKWANKPPAAQPEEPPRPDFRPARYFVENLISGEVVKTEFGEHFETEKLWESHRRLGSMDIGSLIELPHDLLDPLSGGAIPCCHPEKLAFLDTETTGLAGGTGTYAFLVGIGSIDVYTGRSATIMRRPTPTPNSAPSRAICTPTSSGRTAICAGR